MPTVLGRVQSGQGKAHDTLREQMPYFRECFPEIRDIHPATLNILLEKPVVVLVPDFTSPPIPWHPGFRLMKGGEVFQFVRITLRLLEPQPGREVPAWIYRAQFSPYRDNPFYAEVLAPRLDLQGQPRCELTIASHCEEGLVVMGGEEATAPARPPRNEGRMR